MGAEKQMIDVNTGPIVAVVADKHPGRDGYSSEF